MLQKNDLYMKQTQLFFPQYAIPTSTQLHGNVLYYLTGLLDADWYIDGIDMINTYDPGCSIASFKDYPEDHARLQRYVVRKNTFIPYANKNEWDTITTSLAAQHGVVLVWIHKDTDQYKAVAELTTLISSLVEQKRTQKKDLEISSLPVFQINIVIGIEDSRQAKALEQQLSFKYGKRFPVHTTLTATVSHTINLQKLQRLKAIERSISLEKFERFNAFVTRYKLKRKIAGTTIR